MKDSMQMDYETARIAMSAAVIALAGCGTQAREEPLRATQGAPITAESKTAVVSNGFNPRLLRRFAPVRKVIEAEAGPSSDAEVALGRMLYFDTRLSKDEDLSCNSCHKLDAYGVDGERTSAGTKGQRGARNSPTVYHAAGYFAQFWDGRAPSVEEQAKGPILNPVEMAMPSADAVVHRIEAVPEYAQSFARAFPGESNPITYDNVGRAIGAFERGLTTPSRWDDYLRGQKHALTAQEVEGLRVFTNVGCMVCHTGEYLGGTSYQRVGAVEPWPNQTDPGRFKVTNVAADRMMFKVPTLRNIARTAPYFHDGSAKTLDEAVRMMGRHQLGLELGDEEVASIVTWLNSLTGAIPKEYVAKPGLPGGAAKADSPT